MVCVRVHHLNRVCKHKSFEIQLTEMFAVDVLTIDKMFAFAWKKQSQCRCVLNDNQTVLEQTGFFCTIIESTQHSRFCGMRTRALTHSLILAAIRLDLSSSFHAFLNVNMYRLFSIQNQLQL